MNHTFWQNLTRRHFLAAGSHLLGGAALASLLGESRADEPAPRTHHTPKARHVIYLHMVGGPPQMDLYDYKPLMNAWFDRDLPDSVRMGQRLTTMTSGQARFPIAPSKFRFARHGQCGMWVSELLPWTSPDGGRHVLHPLDAHRGDQPRAGHHLHADRQPGHRPALPRRVGVVRPRLAQPQPAHVRRARRPADQHRTGAGDLRAAVAMRASSPASTRACSFRSAGDPILYINNPPGVPPRFAATRSTACTGSTR